MKEKRGVDGATQANQGLKEEGPDNEWYRDYDAILAGQAIDTAMTWILHPKKKKKNQMQYDTIQYLFFEVYGEERS